MKRRSVAAALAVLLVSLAGLIGFQAGPAFAANYCQVTPHCYAYDAWTLANGAGVNAGQVKMKVCSMSAANGTGVTNTFWADLTDGERIQGGINLLSNGGLEFYGAFVDWYGVSHTFHSNDDGVTASPSHWYYVQIIHNSVNGNNPGWSVMFYDGSTLQQLWSGLGFTATNASANIRTLRAGLSSTDPLPVAWSSNAEMQFQRLDFNWDSPWDTPTNPGTYTGFYYGDTTANGAAAWHVGYSWEKTAMNHVLGCL